MRVPCSVFRSIRGVDRWLRGAGLVLIILGYFGPWVSHEAAALTVTGFELAEFAKFFPQVQGGVVPIARELFYLPLVMAFVLLALLAGRPANRLARLIVPPCIAVLLVVVLLPYTVVNALRQATVAGGSLTVDPQYAGQLRLIVVGAALTLLVPLAARLSRRLHAVLVALLALLGATFPLWQFARLYPLVAALYSRAPGLGWGLVVCTTGFILLLLSGITTAPVPPAAPAGQRWRS